MINNKIRRSLTVRLHAGLLAFLVLISVVFVGEVQGEAEAVAFPTDQMFTLNTYLPKDADGNHHWKNDIDTMIVYVSADGNTYYPSKARPVVDTEYKFEFKCPDDLKNCKIFIARTTDESIPYYDVGDGYHSGVGWSTMRDYIYQYDPNSKISYQRTHDLTYEGQGTNIVVTNNQVKNDWSEYFFTFKFQAEELNYDNLKFTPQNEPFYFKVCFGTEEYDWWGRNTEQFLHDAYNGVLAVSWEEQNGTRHLETLQYQGTDCINQCYIYSFTPQADAAYFGITLYLLKKEYVEAHADDLDTQKPTAENCCTSASNVTAIKEINYDDFDNDSPKKQKQDTDYMLFAHNSYFLWGDGDYSYTAPDTIPAGTVVYLDASKYASYGYYGSWNFYYGSPDAFHGASVTAAVWVNADGYTYNGIKAEYLGSSLYKIVFPDDVPTGFFQIVRLKMSDYENQANVALRAAEAQQKCEFTVYPNYELSSANVLYESEWTDCFTVKLTGSTDSLTDSEYEVTPYTAPSNLGRDFGTVPIGFNDTFQDTDDEGNTIKKELFSVPVTFYDYLTDYELLMGWQKNTDDAFSGRINSLNKQPFVGFNDYISREFVAEYKSSWKLPLYFGQFVSGCDTPGDFKSYPYGDLQSISIINAQGDTLYSTGYESRWFYSFDNTGGKTLYNFALFPNSSAASKMWVNTYSGAFQGLVDNTLTSGNLTVGGGELNIPYFSDEIVEDGYANKLNTDFPLRKEVATETIKVVDSEGNEEEKTVNYNYYIFDSGANSSADNDNVYFVYDENGKPTQLNYGYGKKYAVVDASEGSVNSYQGVEGALEQTGFFPFDNNTVTGTESDTKYGYNFGFGMKLEISFRLSKDGKIAGTNVPMEFEFNGDDDVWIFIDDQLALDLGGDHAAGYGKINFANQQSVITTGAISLKDGVSPDYDKESKDIYQTLSVSGQELTQSLPDGMIKKVAGTDDYDVTHTYKLTLFFMERGMSESNLYMKFNMTPIENTLTINNSVDTSQVNSAFESTVAENVKAENYGYNVTDTQATTGDTYYYVTDPNAIDTIYTMDYEDDGLNFNLGDKDTNDVVGVRMYKSGFNIPTTIQGSVVTVEQTNNTEYKLNSSYTVIDVTNNNEEVCSDTKALSASSVDNENSSLKTQEFEFKTGSTLVRTPVNLVVNYENSVAVGSVKITKGVTNNSDLKLDNNEYNFTASITLPDGTTFNTFDYTGKKYVVENGSKNLTDCSGTVTDGEFTLEANEYIIISGIPQNSTITVTEVKEGWRSTSIEVPKNDGTPGTVDSDTDVDGYYYTHIGIGDNPDNYEKNNVTSGTNNSETVNEAATSEKTTSFKLLGSDVTVTFTNNVVVSPDVVKDVAAGKVENGTIVGKNGESLSNVTFSNNETINVAGGEVAVWRIRATLRNSLKMYSKFIFEDTGDKKLENPENFIVTAKDESGNIIATFVRNTDYEVDFTSNDSKMGFTVTFKQNTIDNLAQDVPSGSVIEIIYTTAIKNGVINENYSEIQNNVTLTYGDEPPVVIPDPPAVKTGSVVVGKADGQAEQADTLIYEYSAKFSVYECDAMGNIVDDSAPLYTALTTVNEATGNLGAFKISGIVDGTYCLVETKAPRGYQLNDCKYVFVVKDLKLDAENTLALNTGIINGDGKLLAVYETPHTMTGGNQTVDCDLVIYNYQKTNLPKLGGIGIVIFAVVGVALIVTAVLLLKPSKKKEKNN